MSRFQVDVVATPRLDLCNAAAKDLMYREANGKYPMASRSEIAKEQEKLNKFLRYVNESFIIKGFGKSSSSAQESGTKGYTTHNTAEELWLDGEEVMLCNFDISHGDGTQILLQATVTGDAMKTGSLDAVLTVTILENNSQVARFRQEASGYFTMSVPFMLINRSAGVTKVQVLMKVEDGDVYVDENGWFAQAVAMQ